MRLHALPKRIVFETASMNWYGGFQSDHNFRDGDMHGGVSCSDDWVKTAEGNTGREYLGSRRSVYPPVRMSFAAFRRHPVPPCRHFLAGMIRMDQNQRPKWTAVPDWMKRPTISTSVRQTNECRCHFWIRQGRIDWCKDSGAPAR